MAENTNLNEILDQEPNRLADDAPEAPEDDKVEAEGAEPEVEAKPEEPPKEEPKPEPEPSPTVPLARLNEVLSQKRALEAQLAAMNKPSEERKAPDVFDNPEAYQRYVEQAADERARNHALNISEYLARETHGEKVDKAFEALQSASEADRARIAASPMAWQELVKWYDERRAVQEIGDPDAYRQKIEAEVRERVKAEIEAEMAMRQVRAKPAPAPSLASETSVGGREGSGWSGPTDLNQILG